ncbi:MAG TPA: DUF4136 domain-containing protein [Candidatus Polarisedimenticolaceae bacterium]|nr:DUF4136 domain-containing protein [Candidatus Polarisedimenticolaceae bacterium]
MSRRSSFIVLMLAVLAGPPALAQKITIDYDKDFRGKVETFAWYEHDNEATSLAVQNPLVHSRIVNAIEHFLTTIGLREVGPDATPDLLVTYHTSSTQEVEYNTTNFGYGYPGGWYSPYGYGWGGGASTTTATTYQRGTLVLDAWDAKTEKLIWRGTASAIIPENPEKVTKVIDDALDKMVRKWDKIRKQLRAEAEKGGP